MIESELLPFKNELICCNPEHSEKTEAHGQLVIHFWYGSKNDMKQGTLLFCDKCADKAMFLLEKEFKLKNFLKPIAEF